MAQPTWIGYKLNNRYEITEQLGSGGMSAVYKASDPNLKRVVAIKLIHPHLSQNLEFIRRFEVEAAAVAGLRHPNIVQVYDFAHDGDTYYMVLEYVPGETLQQRLSGLSVQGEKQSVEEVISLASKVCAAVDYAHKHSLIHRDIKPANIIIDMDGEPVLMDFGIVKIVGDEQHTATGAVIGTALYMSPEQIHGERPDHRADIYSLGVVIYEMLSGKPPFQADSAMSIMMLHLNQPVPDILTLSPNTPPAFKEIIEKALAKDPADRFQTAGELAAAIRRVPITVSAPAPSAPETLANLPKPGPPPKPPEPIRSAGTLVEDAPAAAQKQPSPPAPAPAQPQSDPILYAGTLIEDAPAAAQKQPGPSAPAPAQPQPAPARSDLKKSGNNRAILIGGGAVIAIILAIVLVAIIVPRLLGGNGGGNADDATAPPVAAVGITATSLPAADATDAPAAETTVPPTDTSVPTIPPTHPATEFPAQILDAFGVSMALIPAGAFQMGSEAGGDESPIHTVFLDAFYLDQYEVTNQNYGACVDAGVCGEFDTSEGRDPSFAQHPVRNIDWDEAGAYCGWRGGFLPTEAQWEKAARGGLEGMEFPWGNEPASCNLGAINGAHFASCGANTVPVGNFGPNGYGLYDIVGNVWEWAADWYGRTFYAESPDTNPIGPTTGEIRVRRGGSWGYNESYLRAANRTSVEAITFTDIGIRCASLP